MHQTTCHSHILIKSMKNEEKNDKFHCEANYHHKQQKMLALVSIWEPNKLKWVS